MSTAESQAKRQDSPKHRRAVIRASAIVLVVAAVCLLHISVAVRRSARMLEHDEAISLLAAAGQSMSMDRYYEGLREGRIQVLAAGEMQELMRASAAPGLAGVLHSLGERDIHPPLYFIILHGLQRLGLQSHAALRLFGVLPVLLAAWIGWRWIWPAAPFVGKLMATMLIALTPAVVEIATELRQYALVYLGTVLSFAALVAYWEVRASWRETIVLLSAAPIVLLWSQFGTAVWVAVALAIVLAGLVRGPAYRWRTLGWSVLAAAVFIGPLAWWRVYGATGGGGPTLRPLSWSGIAEASQTVLLGAGRTWLSLPGRWPGEVVWPVAVVGLLLVGCSVAMARRSACDWMLLCGAVVWTLIWILWLACAQIPEQAGQIKHLGPLLLCPLVLLTRATSTQNKPWVRRTAVAVLIVSLASHLLVGSWQLLTGFPRQRAAAALRQTPGLLVDYPKRGYVLPLVAELAPHTPVIIVSPTVAAARWEELSRLLPTDGLILAEIDSFDDGKRTPAAQAMLERLTEMYGRGDVLHAGPRRTVTEFKREPAQAGSRANKTDGVMLHPAEAVTQVCAPKPGSALDWRRGSAAKRPPLASGDGC